MKGGEGWFLVVLSITICMPDIYIDRVKGDGFFSSDLNGKIYIFFIISQISNKTKNPSIQAKNGKKDEGR